MITNYIVSYQNNQVTITGLYTDRGKDRFEVIGISVNSFGHLIWLTEE
jgi:hypothetical protein